MASRRSVAEAVESLQRSVREREDLIPFEEEPAETPCREVESPAGWWVLAAGPKERAVYLREHPGAAVFTRDEIRTLETDLQDMPPADRQAWLADILTIKSVLGTATVRSVRPR